MTKTSLLFIALFIAMSSMAQNAIIKSNFSHFPNQNSIETKSGFDLFTANKSRAVQHPAQQQKSKMAKVAASTVTKQRLDSMIRQQWDDSSSKMVNSSKEEYVYDAAGNMILYATYNWNIDGSEWVGDQKEVYAFDNNGNKILDIFYGWSSTTRQWVERNKNEYTFDTKGNITNDIYFSWDVSIEQWKANNKHEYIYDISGNNTIDLAYNSYTLDVTWNLFYKVEYTYDANGNKTLLKYYDLYSTNPWELSRKTEYTNDAKGNNTLLITSNWRNSKWIPSNKEENNYDAFGNKTLKASYNWTTQWTGSSKYEYAYDTNGNKTSNSYSNWNSITNQWKNIDKDEYTYDANGNSDHDFNYTWNTTTNLWKLNYKTTMIFDTTYLLKDILSGNFFDDSMTINNMLTAGYMYNYDGTNWNLQVKVQLYYSTQDIQSATKTVLSDAVNVYPNPASSYVTFNFEKAVGQYTLHLSDLQGKIFINQPIENNARVSVEMIPKGLYLYKITASDRTYNGKLMLK